ncbi:MAG TPA: SNF2-related protein [Candidatus Xenobia bacterium]
MRGFRAAATGLDKTHDEWLDAQEAAWLSLWEIVAFRPHRWISLRDCITGVERRVLDPDVLPDTSIGHVRLARVVTFGGIDFFGAYHPTALTRQFAQRVLDRFVAHHGLEIPVSLLQTGPATLELIRIWDEEYRGSPVEVPPARPQTIVPQLPQEVMDVLALIGRPVSPVLLAAALRRTPNEVERICSEHGLRPSSAVSLPPEQASAVLREAVARGRLANIPDLGPWRTGEPEIRRALASGDFEGYQKAIHGTDPTRAVVDLFLRPPNPTAFAALYPGFRARLTSFLVRSAIDDLLDLRPLLPFLEAHPEERAELALLSGDVEEAFRLRGGDLVGQALAEFVNSPSAAADPFDRALREVRRQEASQRTLPGLAGLFHVVALYGAGRLADAERLAKAGQTLRYQPLVHIGRVLRGRRVALPDPGDGSIDLLVQGLALLWSETLYGAFGARLVESEHRARAAGLEWLADQYVHLVRYTTVAFQVQRRSTRFASLADLVPRYPSWQRTLDALEKAISRTRPVDGRVAWFLTWLDDEVVEIEARLQVPRSGGVGWTSGQLVGADAVTTGKAAVHATDQDVEAANAWAIERPPGYPRTLKALVGHCTVFDISGEPLEISTGQPTFYVEPHTGGHLCRIHPPSNRPWHVERKGRIVTVYSLSRLHRSLSDHLGLGTVFPTAGKERLVQLIQRLSKDIQVVSVLPVRDSDEADPRIYLQMSPHGGVYVVSVRVRPFGTETPSFVPGQGGATVSSEGRAVRRDLAREVEGATLLGQEDGALELPQTLDLLERVRALGDAVVVEWPPGASLRVRHANRAALRLSGDGDWFAVDGEVATDEGEMLTLRVVLSALEHRGGRFVALGRGEFLALEERLRQQLAQLQAYGGIRVHRLSIPGLLDWLGPASGDDAWRSHVARLQSPGPADLTDDFAASLRDYQMDGFRWLVRLARWGAGALLADDMGLGKTIQSLALLAWQAHQPGPGCGALVVAPTSVLANWLDETWRFAPGLKPRLYEHPLGLVAANDVVICSYTMLHLRGEELADMHWRTILLDEAQAVKNAETRRAQAASKLRADFRLATTGTPVENHLDDLWSLFRFLVPGLLGTRAAFRQRFRIPVEQYQDEGVREQLRVLVAPFILRRTKAQVLPELPPRTEIQIQVELEERERALYEGVRQEALAHLHLEPDRMRLLADLMKLRRACCHPRLVIAGSRVPSSKLEAFGRIVDDLMENAHRALVFSQFTDHLELVARFLDERNMRYQYLDGSTPGPVRRERVAAFQDGTDPLFLISLRAGGTGLNLTAADYVIHLDPWWNPAVEDQASDRAHRLGQQRPVTVYRLVARNTVEEKVVALHRHKRELAEALLEGADATARLPEKEFVELLSEVIR